MEPLATLPTIVITGSIDLWSRNIVAKGMWGFMSWRSCFNLRLLPTSNSEIWGAWNHKLWFYSSFLPSRGRSEACLGFTRFEAITGWNSTSLLFPFFHCISFDVHHLLSELEFSSSEFLVMFSSVQVIAITWHQHPLLEAGHCCQILLPGSWGFLFCWWHSVFL